MKYFEDLKIAVAGTGYVGLSIATLLSQHHRPYVSDDDVRYIVDCIREAIVE